MNEQKMNALEYVGFWSRVGASLLDTLFQLIILFLFMYFLDSDTALFADDEERGIGNILFEYILLAIVVICFWIYKSATPGKMIIKAIIVDASSGMKPSTSQYIIRYFAYFISLIPLGLGFFWIGWDKQKQGWHDKLAKTIVIRGTMQDIEKNKDSDK